MRPRKPRRKPPIIPDCGNHTWGYWQINGRFKNPLTRYCKFCSEKMTVDEFLQGKKIEGFLGKKEMNVNIRNEYIDMWWN